MSSLTVLFVFVIVVCTFFTVLFNIVSAKLGQVESSQKELQSHRQRHFLLQKKPAHEIEPVEGIEITKISELAELEEELELAKQSYDTAVMVYNEAISKFPGLLVAGMLGFKEISGERDDGF